MHPVKVAPKFPCERVPTHAGLKAQAKEAMVAKKTIMESLQAMVMGNPEPAAATPKPPAKKAKKKAKKSKVVKKPAKAAKFAKNVAKAKKTAKKAKKKKR